MNNDYPSRGTTPVSAHRAVLYAAGVPGWGEYIAGARLQGLATLLGFLCSSAVFCWSAWLAFQSLMAFTSPPDSVTTAFGLSLLAMLAIWLWGMFNAARASRCARMDQGALPQCSPAWGAFFSWICPGCGQAYAGRTLFGFMLMLLSLAGTALMAPAFTELGRALHEMLLDPANANNPLLVAGQVKELFFVLHNSLPSIFGEGLKMLSIAEAVAVLRIQRLEQESFFDIPGDEPARRPWYKTNEARAGGLFILGWFAPGAGQLLLGRSYGWIFLGAFLGGQLLLALALRHDYVSVPLAMTLSWIPAIIRIIAMIEAPLRLLSLQPRLQGNEAGARR